MFSQANPKATNARSKLTILPSLDDGAFYNPAGGIERRLRALVAKPRQYAQAPSRVTPALGVLQASA